MQTFRIILHVIDTSHICRDLAVFFLRQTPIFVLIVALHEVGHLVSAWVLGVRVKKIGISWKGIYIRREAGPLGRNLFITLSGPMTNLICADLWHWFPSFGLFSLVLALTNLVPICGSDGDRALTYIATLLGVHSRGVELTN